MRNGIGNTTPVVIKLFGPNGPALPSGMAFSPDGSMAYVALNGSNTLGVIDTATNTFRTQIPVGNAPRQVVLVGNEAFVSNEGGRPARPGDFTNLSDGTPIVADSSTGAASTGTVSVVDLGTGQQTGSISVGLEPTALYLHGSTLLVANSNDDSVSVIDTTTDPSLAQFGANVTPNQHALANTFGLFDNFYDEGTLSADGRNWLMQADANDYIEKEFGAFFRSYPAQGGDALAYQRDGFLWNAAERAGLTVVSFGEYNNFFNIPATGYPTWQQWYQDSQILEGKAGGPLPVPENQYSTYADIPSLNAIDDHAYPRFDLDVPDQYRTDVWLQSFQQSEKTGQLANLNLLWLPDDHTSGVGSGDPNPVAQVADNDLALGRIVDTISHSPFWKSSAIFVV